MMLITRNTSVFVNEGRLRKFLMSSMVVVAAAMLLTGANVRVAIGQERDQSVGEEATSPIDELIGLYEKSVKQIEALRKEVATLKLELSQAVRERDEMKQFIEDHDAYSSDFEKYAVFREQQFQNDAARKIAEAKAKRDERKRRYQEMLEQRRAQRAGKKGAANDPLIARVKVLQQAGFTRIGEFVFVGQMGYVYKTESKKEYRYSPWLRDWYVGQDEQIDYTNLTLSGSIVHSSDGLHDLSIAIAFYDSSGGQIGQTTVRVDGARPGVPYPFTSEVKMAANVPFDNYTAWILYADATDVGDGGEPIGPGNRGGGGSEVDNGGGG